MAVEPLSHVETERTSAAHKAHASTIEEVAETATWGTRQRPRELYVKADWVVRIGAGLLAGALLIAAIAWSAAGFVLFSPPPVVCAGCAPADLFRWGQLLLTIAGVAATVAVALYAARYAFVGRIWPHRRRVANGFGTLLVAWSLVVIVNHVL